MLVAYVPMNGQVTNERVIGAFRITLIEHAAINWQAISANPSSITVTRNPATAYETRWKFRADADTVFMNSREGLDIPNYYISFLIENTNKSASMYSMNGREVKLVGTDGNNYPAICAMHGEIWQNMPFNFTGAISIEKSLPTRPTVILSISKSPDAFKWSLNYSRNGSFRFTVFFFLPDGAGPAKLLWPDTEPYVLRAPSL
jgi:hypothetical protein